MQRSDAGWIGQLAEAAGAEAPLYVTPWSDNWPWISSLTFAGASLRSQRPEAI